VLASRDVVRAERETLALAAEYPGSAAVQALLGTVRMAKGDRAAARIAYQEAYRLDPESIAALTGLTVLDMQENKAAAARARLDARLAATPNRPDLLVLVSKVYVAQRDLGSAERVLRHAIDVDAATLDAYGILVEIYREQKKVEPARLEFDALAGRNPRSVGARTMSALLLHAQANVAEAKRRYIEVLAMDPRAAVAANNLAWIYADEAENLDLALQLAQRAADQLPERAELRDTVGWVYYRKQLPQLAIAPFAQAVAQQPENPTFHYHLGLAYVRSGDRVRGREAFERALTLSPEYGEAKRELAYLQ
jgi:Tfp pilus assembly protein PilF